jgi:hypothetical protein
MLGEVWGEVRVLVLLRQSTLELSSIRAAGSGQTGHHRMTRPWPHQCCRGLARPLPAWISHRCRWLGGNSYGNG